MDVKRSVLHSSTTTYCPENLNNEEKGTCFKELSIPNMTASNQTDSAKLGAWVINPANSDGSIKRFLAKRHEEKRVITDFDIQDSGSKTFSPDSSTKRELVTGESDSLIEKEDKSLELNPKKIKQLFRQIKTGDGCTPDNLFRYIFSSIYSACNSCWEETSNSSWLDITIDMLGKIYSTDDGWAVQEKTNAEAGLTLLLFQFILFKKKYYDPLSDEAETALHKLEKFQQDLWKRFYLAHGRDALLELYKAKSLKVNQSSAYDDDPRRTIDHQRFKRTLEECWIYEDKRHLLPDWLQELRRTEMSHKDIESHIGISKSQSESLESERQAENKAALQRRKLLPFYKKYASQPLQEFPRIHELSGFVNVSKSCFTSPAIQILLLIYRICPKIPPPNHKLSSPSLEAQFSETYCTLYNLFHSGMTSEMQVVFRKLLTQCMALQGNGRALFFENNIQQNLKKKTIVTSPEKPETDGCQTSHYDHNAIKTIVPTLKKPDKTVPVETTETLEDFDYNPSMLEPDDPSTFMESLINLVTEKKQRNKYSFRLEPLDPESKDSLKLGFQKQLPKPPTMNSVILQVTLQKELADKPEANLQDILDQLFKNDYTGVEPFGYAMAVDASQFELFTISFQFGFSDEAKEFILADSISRDSCKVVNIIMYDLRTHQFKEMQFEKVASIFHARKYSNYPTPENLGDHFRTSIKMESLNKKKLWHLFDGTHVYTTFDDQADSDEHFICGMTKAITLKRIMVPR